MPSTPSLCRQLARMLVQRHWMLVTAESCTGGRIAAACTELAGSSAWFERGFVTYSNAAKTHLLGVDPGLIERHGAVSPEVACAMARGALAASPAQVSVAVTGVAGPAGGSPAKPVGTVWFAWATPAGVQAEVQHFSGNRRAVRCASVRHALRGLIERIDPKAL